jgi:hypothetical protein
MKKIILFLLLFVIDFSINALDWDDSIGYFNFSFSKEYNQNNNYSIGYELIFDEYNFLNCFRFNYRFGENGNVFNLHYYIMPGTGSWSVINSAFSLMSFGAGTNISYNINKNIFGIGPHINMSIILFMFMKFDIAYRYNIYFNSINSHEIEFTIGLLNLLR